MSRHPAPTRSHHQTFCLTEEWTQVRNATGRTGHHVVFELGLPDGRILRTRISHPVGKDTDGASIWSHLLRDQLDVTEEEFWACVPGGVTPDRGARETPAETIPAGVVSQLLAYGVGDEEIRGMSRTAAIQRLGEIWSRPQGEAGTN